MISGVVVDDDAASSRLHSDFTRLDRYPLNSLR